MTHSSLDNFCWLPLQCDLTVTINRGILKGPAVSLQGEESLCNPDSLTLMHLFARKISKIQNPRQFFFASLKPQKFSRGTFSPIIDLVAKSELNPGEAIYCLN